MRIVLSNSSTKWGGVQTVTEILARGLSLRGHEVRVFGFPGGTLEEHVRGFAAFEPIVGGVDFNPRVLWNVMRSMRRNRPEVVLTLMKKDTTMTAMVAAMMKIPVVIRHANDRPLHRGPYGQTLYGSLPTLHVVNAEATKRTLLRSAPWLSADRIKVIYNGTDADRYEAAEPDESLVPPGDLAIGYVGAFESRKGVIELAKAWPEIAAAIPDAHLILCGKGSREKEMRSIFGDAPRVKWLGYRKDVTGILKALDILILPSHVEGAPNVVLEAMAAGVPVVATAVSGTPELMRDGIEGALVQDRDAPALVGAVVRLASDPAARSGMADAGRRRVAERFTIGGMLDAYEEMFAGVVQSNRRGINSTIASRPSKIAVQAEK